MSTERKAIVNYGKLFKELIDLLEKNGLVVGSISSKPQNKNGIELKIVHHDPTITTDFYNDGNVEEQQLEIDEDELREGLESVMKTYEEFIKEHGERYSLEVEEE